MTYSPESVLIRIAKAASDGGGGSSGDGAIGGDSNTQSSASEYSFDNQSNSPVLTPPGVGVEIPMGSAMTPEGYRSAGILSTFGPAQASSAAPAALSFDHIPEVSSKVSEYDFLNASGAVSEKHYIVPQGVFRVRGWNSSTQSAVDWTGATETLVEVYDLANYNLVAHTFTVPHSYYRLEIATGNNLQPGLRVVESNHGTIRTRSMQASSDGLVSLATDGTRATETIVTPPAQEEKKWQRTIIVRTDGIVTSSVLETHDLLTYDPGNDESTRKNYVLVSSAEYPTANPSDELATCTSYYGDGRVCSVSRPDGSWSYYTYDGDTTTAYSPWLSSSSLQHNVGDGSWSLPSSGKALKTVSSENSSGSSSNSYLVDYSAGGTCVQLSGSATSRSTVAGITVTTRTEYRSNNPLTSLGPVRSYSLAYSDDNTDRFLAGRTLMIWDATGRATLYQYERGAWAAPVFTPNSSGACVRALTITGYVSSPTAASTPANFTSVSSHSTKDVIITATEGVVREETYICNGTNSYSLAVAKDHEYEPDGQHRPTGVKTGGIDIARTEYVSPSVTRQWDENGTMTETETNGQGEVIRSTVAGNTSVPPVTTTNTRHGLTTTTTVNGQTVAVEVLDAAGRTVSSTNAIGAVVETAYADGVRTVTRTTAPTAPSHVTTVESRHFDGQPISTTGNGVIPQYFSYSVDSDGLVTTTTAVGTETSLRSTSVTRNWDGSTASESSPDPTGGNAPVTRSYGYASGSSALLRIHSSAANTADTIQIDPATSAAAAMGHYSLSGAESDGNGPVIATGNDRLTETTTSYVSSEGVWSQQTVTSVFHKDGFGDSYTQTSLQALTPVAVNHATYGNGLRWTSSISSGTTTVITTRDSFPSSSASVVSTDDSATTVSPDSVTISRHGKTVSSAVYGASHPETLSYDSAGCLVRQTSATGALTVFGYNPHSQLETTMDHAGKATVYAYYPSAHPNAGLLWKTTNPENETTETSYNERGQVAETNGNGSYRVTYGYNTFGEKETMLTYRSANSSGDLTHWTIDPASGVLLGKTDALGKSTTYAHDSAGRILTRLWARPGTVTTTYTYNPFGDLTNTDYSDGTPGVTVVPDRVGRPQQITDASGTRTLTYQPVTGGLDLVSYGSGGLLPSLAVDYTWDSSLRPAGYAVSGGGPASVMGYDDEGRLKTVSADGANHTHGYIPGTGTLSSLTTAAGTTTILTRTLYHDRMQRLPGIETRNGAGSTLSRHGYVMDGAGRRTHATRENGQRWDYGYDHLGEVTSAVKKFPDATAIPGHSFSYQFDGIGNRASATQGGTGSAVTYTPNALNQYSAIATEGGRFILGEAPPANAVTINGSAATRAGGLGFYWKQLSGDNSENPLWSNDTVASNGITISGNTWTPKVSVTPVHDFDGNLTFDGRWDYSWNAENRPTRMQTTTAAANAGVPRQRLDFVYDSQGRRVSKTVSTSNDGTSWSFASNLRFLYDGWNLIAEYSAPSESSTSLTLQAAHTWGIDLSGTPQGAGGVGGLLSSNIQNPTSNISCFPAFDGNGNISAWIGSNGTLLARMEYSPFGQLIAQYKFTAALDDTLSRLHFGFSTKYTDRESGLLDYVHRLYDPVSGRWKSRDPIGEEGGVNLYGFVWNSPVNRTDILGMKAYMVYRRLNIPLLKWIPLAGHVFLAFTEEGADANQRSEWRRGMNALGLTQRDVHTFSFHPTAVFVDRAKEDKVVGAGVDNGNRLSVLNTRASYIDIDELTYDIASFRGSGQRSEVASNWCDQIKIFNKVAMSVLKNNGAIGFYQSARNGNQVSIDYGGTPDPGPYSFLHNNCAHWAWTMTQRAGLRSSNFGNSVLNSAWNGGVGMQSEPSKPKPMALVVPTHMKIEAGTASRWLNALGLMKNTAIWTPLGACLVSESRHFSLRHFAGKVHLHPTEHPNAMPASERCPGQPREVLFVPGRTPGKNSVRNATRSCDVVVRLSGFLLSRQAGI